MTRILVDARVGWGSGIGRVNEQLLPRVAALRRRWSFDVLIPTDQEEATRALFSHHANVTVRPTSIAPFSLAEQRRLPALAHGHDLTWFTNYWLPLRWSAPFVSTVYDVLHLEPDLFEASRLNRILARATFEKVRRQARAVFFISRFTRRAFERKLGPARSSHVIHLGADHLPAVDAGPGVGDREKRVLIVAAAKAHKNFALAIEAWRAAAPPAPWRLTIISPQPARSTLPFEELISGIDNIEVLRGIDDAMLQALYARSAILLMPSRYEGFGLPLIEAFAAGLFPVSSTAEALVEIAEGATLSFANPGDVEGWRDAIRAACNRVDRGGDALATLLADNRAIARRFRWDRTADGVVAMLDEALDGLRLSATGSKASRLARN